MGEIIHRNLDEAFAEECAYSEVVAAGDWVYLTFCVGNVGGKVEEQVHGALNHLEARLALVGLTAGKRGQGGRADAGPVADSGHGKGVQGTVQGELSGTEDHCHGVCPQGRRGRAACAAGCRGLQGVKG